MNRIKLYKFYEYLMIILALVVVGIVISDFAFDLSADTVAILEKVDLGILIVFAADYFFRLTVAKDKKHFITHNKIDLIAIIPVYSIFRAFRLARFARLARLSRINRLVRAGVWMERYWEKLAAFVKTNGLIYMITLTVLMILGGAIGAYFLEGMSFYDGIWWSFITTTTGADGSQPPDSAAGRILAGVLMMVGIGFIGMLTGTIATYFIRGVEEPKSYKAELVERAKGKLEHFDDLSEEDLRDMFQVMISLKKGEE